MDRIRCSVVNVMQKNRNLKKGGSEPTGYVAGITLNEAEENMVFATDFQQKA